MIFPTLWVRAAVPAASAPLFFRERGRYRNPENGFAPENGDAEERQAAAGDVVEKEEQPGKRGPFHYDQNQQT